MILKTLIIICIISAVYSSMILWSTKKIDYPALKVLTENEFLRIIESLGSPKYSVFEVENAEVPKAANLVSATFTTYVPNENVSFLRTTVLPDLSSEYMEEIQKEFSSKDDEDYLVILMTSKKWLPNDDETSDDSVARYYEVDQSAVALNTFRCLFYSARPPLITIDGDTVSLASHAQASEEKDGDVLHMHIIITEGEKKYKCSYTFNMFHGFWSLKQVVLTVDQTPPHILFPKTEVGAPRGYSFKCPQKTIFQDAKGKVTLELTDFQVQAFRPGSFETAIYCIPSITPIIFSGLFVTILLVSVLLTSIYALLNIEGFKTFDTSKMEILYTHQE